MESKDLVSKPIVARLQEQGTALRIKEVFGDRVLVKTTKPVTALDEAKKLGIVIPEAVEKANLPPPSTGVVVMMGEAAGERLHLGDMVLFSKFAGANFLIDQEEFKILDWGEIWAVLEESDQGDNNGL